jgi:hypothetical protein
MTRTRLDDAQWMSLMLVMQQIPLAWKRDGSGHRPERASPLRRGCALDWPDGRTVA